MFQSVCIFGIYSVPWDDSEESALLLAINKVTGSCELKKTKQEPMPHNENCYNLGEPRVAWESPAVSKW